MKVILKGERMFTFMWNSQPKDLTSQEILEFTNKHFHPLPSSQLELMHEAPLALLRELDINQTDFNKKYDEIIFGTIFVALAYEYDKYHIEAKSKYALLMPMCNVKQVADLERCSTEFVAKHPGFRDLIVNTGSIILETKYIQGYHIDRYFPSNRDLEFKRFLKQRLSRYNSELNEELMADVNRQSTCTIL